VGNVRGFVRRIWNKRDVKAFSYGLILRLIAEIINGKYPLGSDANTFYVLKFVYMDLVRELAYGFVYQYIIFGLGLFLGNIFLAIKIVACIISGLLVLSIYLWGRKSGLDEEMALKYAIIAFMYFTILEISWDLQRNALGLALILIAIAIMNEKFLVACFIAALAGLTHPFTIFVVGSILFVDIIHRKKREIFLFLSNATAVGFIVYCRLFVVGKDVSGFVSATGQIWHVPPHLMPVFFIYISLPVLILMLISYGLNSGVLVYLKEKNNLCWIVVSLLISPFLVFGYRILLMVSIPLVFFAFRMTKHSSKRLFKALAVICVVSSATYQPFIYVYPWYPGFRHGIGIITFGSCMAPWDVDDAERLLKEAWLMVNDSVGLVIHHSEIGIAYAVGIPIKDRHIVLVTGPLGPVTEFDRFIEVALNNFTRVLVVWYISPPIGSVDIPRDRHYMVFDRSSNMALYIFCNSSSFGC